MATTNRTLATGLNGVNHSRPGELNRVVDQKQKVKVYCFGISFYQDVLPFMIDIIALSDLNGNISTSISIELSLKTSQPLIEFFKTTACLIYGRRHRWRWSASLFQHSGYLMLHKFDSTPVPASHEADPATAQSRGNIFILSQDQALSL